MKKVAVIAAVALCTIICICFNTNTTSSAQADTLIERWGHPFDADTFGAYKELSFEELLDRVDKVVYVTRQELIDLTEEYFGFYLYGDEYGKLDAVYWFPENTYDAQACFSDCYMQIRTIDGVQYCFVLDYATDK